MHSSQKGDLGVSRVIHEALKLGLSISIPFSENQRYDLIIDRNGTLERVQVKTTSSGEVLKVVCESKAERCNYRYTQDDFEWLVTYDLTTDKCYYIPSSMLGEGRRTIQLRLAPPKNNQSKGILWAKDFMSWHA